ncbi:GNAT family N-acetyltransferase [Thalassovita mangrovi]|uniref:GNAT family N-acetyltransferase n=1 Tax=Thalassovita mangrovi TaxID=2692236 RepID=A0A6L8LPG3_9RHOB|nr:GNAT family N-acetyltransferase [Thalassovita mangrovi]MYM55039.1 GNAT family N-acetyltransferase [Thalassovita mangrovi]
MSWDISESPDLAACHALRREVFIEEQGIAEPDEWDDLDDQAVHLLATIDGVPVGTARLLTDGSTGKIGRICVVKSQRGTGLGAALVREGIDRLSAMEGIETIRLGAQQYAIGFYEKLGFAVCGPVYDDAGIPHSDMERPV